MASTWISVGDRLPAYNERPYAKVVAFDGELSFLANYVFTVHRNTDTQAIERITGIFHEWFHGHVMPEPIRDVTHWRYPVQGEIR